MDAIETIEKDGWKVEVFPDLDATSPDDWDNLATFVHSTNYTFGEPMRHEPSRGWRNYIRALGIFGDDVAAVLPVRVEDYGSRGVTVYDSDAENANGVLYTTHKRLNELCGEDPQYHAREWVENALKGELEVWRQYMEGEVYGWAVTRPDGSDDDSCWGFYGLDYAVQEATEALDACIEHEAREVAKIERITAS